MLSKFYWKKPYSWFLGYNPSHLWFLQLLLFFAIVYLIYRVIDDRNTTKKLFQVFQDRFPPDFAIILSIIILTILTYIVRIKFSVGMWFLYIQPGHFVHYTFSFFVGILAYRGDWFTRLAKSQARGWGITTLVVIPLWVVGPILGGAFVR